jgi:hypothetical protein
MIIGQNLPYSHSANSIHRRRGRDSAFRRQHLAEELGSMTRVEWRELRSQFRVLLAYLVGSTPDLEVAVSLLRAFKRLEQTAELNSILVVVRRSWRR